MRNALRRGLVMLMALFMIFIMIPGRSAEARSYKVLKYDVLAEIQPNGDVRFTEKVKYDFSGDYNGVYRDVDMDGAKDQTLGDLKVSVVNEDGSLREIKEKSGSSDAGYVLSGYSIKQIKVYEKSSNEIKTIQYQYTLKGLAERYKDIAQINRKFVDRHWEVPLNLVDVTIRIPEGAKKEDLRVWGHGDLLGVTEIVDDRTFKASIGTVEPGETVEVLAVFPKELLKDVTDIKDEERLPTILATEQKFADEANAVRDKAKADIEEGMRRNATAERRRAVGRQLTPVLIGSSVLGVLGAIFAGMKFGKKTPSSFEGEYYRELPGDYSPAVASALMGGMNGIGSKDIMATILDLARKKAIDITPYTATKTGFLGREKTEEDYVLTGRIDNATEPLKDHEMYLYNWFINELGVNGQLKMDDLEETMKSKKNGLKFASKFNTFKDKIKALFDQQKFFMGRSVKGSAPFFILGLLMMVAGVLLFITYENFMALLLAGAGGVMFFTMLIISITPVQTPYGAEQTSKWGAFKRFLLHFSNLDKSEIPSLTVWNHYLVYAAALGVAKEVIEQLPKVFPQHELETQMRGGTYYPMFYGNSYYRMDRTISNTLSSSMSAVRQEQIANSARSSGSGGGGGFSSGSSGGSGGGGGGGAF